MNLKFGWVQKHRKGFSVNRVYPRHISFHASADDERRLSWKRWMSWGTSKSTLWERSTVSFGRLETYRAAYGPGCRDNCGYSYPSMIFRLADEDDDEIRRGEGRYVARYRAIMDRPDWYMHIKFWPHIHVIGWGRLKTVAAFLSTGMDVSHAWGGSQPCGSWPMLSCLMRSVSRGSKAYVPIGEMHSSKMACVVEYRYSRTYPVLRMSRRGEI